MDWEMQTGQGQASTAQADWDDQHRRNQERGAKVTGWKPGASPAPTMTAEQQTRAKALECAVKFFQCLPKDKIVDIDPMVAAREFEDYIRGEKC